MSRHISQREARRNWKLLRRLEEAVRAERRAYSQEYFGGVELMRCRFSGSEPLVVRTARNLGHAVVVVGDDSDVLRFIALPHPKVGI